MSFLALASQKSLLGLQKSFLQLQYTKISNQIQYAEAEMAAIQKEYSQEEDSGGVDYSDDPMYIHYEQWDEQLESEKDSLDSQLTAIDAQISSLKTMVNNNIKSSCQLNLASGG